MHVINKEFHEALLPIAKPSPSLNATGNDKDLDNEEPGAPHPDNVGLSDEDEPDRNHKAPSSPASASPTIVNTPGHVADAALQARIENLTPRQKAMKMEEPNEKGVPSVMHEDRTLQTRFADWGTPAARDKARK